MELFVDERREKMSHEYNSGGIFKTRDLQSEINFHLLVKVKIYMHEL